MSERRVFEGRVQDHVNNDVEWWSLEEDDDAGNCSSDASWLEGLEGKRVRITVEVLDDPQPTAARAEEGGRRGVELGDWADDD